MNDQHRALRLATRAEIRARRLRKTLGRRVDEAMLRARVQASPRGQSLNADRVAMGGSESAAPTGGVDPDVDKFARAIFLAVEGLERLVDGYAYRSLAAEHAGEGSDERDKRLIRDFEGYEPNEVIYVDPSFGSVRAVERARVRMGRDPFRGGAMS